MKYRAFEEAIEDNETFTSNFTLPFTKNDLFKKKSFDFDHFNMKMSQRIMGFIICFFCGVISMFYAFLHIFGAITNPIRFAFPYAISNYFFFIMFGFIFGFKTYLTKVFQGKRGNYTIAFITSTFLTIYASFYFKSYFLHLALCIGQIVTFVAFVIALFPGGSDGLTSLLKLILKR